MHHDADGPDTLYLIQEVVQIVCDTSKIAAQ